MVIKSVQPSYPDAREANPFESGVEFQDFVADLFCRHLGIALTNYQSKKWQFGQGENRQGIEIKLDRRILDTGNVSIEVGEKTKHHNGDYAPSGILRDDNSWLYIQGNYDIILVFSKVTLKLLYDSKRYRVDDLPTIRRFLMPLDFAKKVAAKVIEIPKVSA